MLLISVYPGSPPIAISLLFFTVRCHFPELPSILTLREWLKTEIRMTRTGEAPGLARLQKRSGGIKPCHQELMDEL
jgi:hypothetical protein